MRAVMVEEPERLAVAEVAEPAPGPGQALVRVERSGVCGTDLKILAGGIPVDYPRVLGHELVGSIVESAGEIPVGARVLVNPSIECGRCRLCRADREHLCPNGALMGRDVDGGFADYVAVDEAQLHPLPDVISDERSGLLQVLGTCVHGQRAAEVFPGQVAVVIGLGVAGLLMVQLLRARGVDRVIGVTRSASKRAIAESLGAAATAPPDGAAALVDEVSAGQGADLVVECVGSVGTMSQAIELSGIGATVVMFGIVPATEGRLPFYQLYHKELSIRNPRAAQARDYDTAIDLVAAGRVDVDPLLSASYPLGEAADAFAALEAGGGLLKVTLDHA